MRWTRCGRAAEFVARAADFLEQREAENNLMLGLALAMTADPDYASLPPLLSYATHGRRVVAAALQMPPRALIVTRMTPAAQTALVDHLCREKAQFKGLLGPSETAFEVARLYTAATGAPHEVDYQQRIYQLTAVRPPAGVPGRLRPAAAHEVDFLVPWAIGFGRDMPRPWDPDRAEQMLRGQLRQGSTFIWENGKPVAMAGFAGPTPHGVRVNLVYTPPEHRRQGYASACVAALSQRLLDGGRKFCFLYADRDNPTSNHIYQQIGYELVCESVELRIG